MLVTLERTPRGQGSPVLAQTGTSLHGTLSTHTFLMSSPVQACLDGWKAHSPGPWALLRGCPRWTLGRGRKAGARQQPPLCAKETQGPAGAAAGDDPEAAEAAGGVHVSGGHAGLQLPPRSSPGLRIQPSPSCSLNPVNDVICNLNP